MGSRVIMKWAVRILIVFMCTTGLLMVYLGSSSFHEDDTQKVNMVQKKKAEIVDNLRRRRLLEIRKHLFDNPDRPADWRYNINVTWSEHTPLERDVIDSRPPACRDIKYDLSKFGTITVIIPFYNEALSMLLRTVHSVLRKTPPQLLEEIIIIDDDSKNKDLKEPLARYVKYLPKTKLYRTPKREGLIRVRMIGARLAKGDVLMFQDAHTEANVGWAEPLLEEFRKNPHQVIQPHVDAIDAMTLKYHGSSGVVSRGGFNWDLRYTWMRVPAHERQRLKSPTDPQRTATLVGCAVAVKKDYFFHIGGFDDNMNVWGGENIELAFRTWLCHGQVMTHPCSRVAHVFKEFSYSFDGDKDTIVTKNLMRIAEMWMGSYKKYFYAVTYNYPFKRVYFEPNELVTLNKRKQAMKKLNCRPFEWYMKNIVPEIPRPPDDATWYGEVTNYGSKACFFVMDDGFIGLTYFCFFHRVLPENLFHIDTNGRLMYNDKCVTMDKKLWLMRLAECVEGETWDVIPRGEVRGMIRLHYKSGPTRKALCVLQVTNVVEPHKGAQMPQMVDCDPQNDFQVWDWSYKMRYDYNFDPPKSKKS